MWVNDDIYLRTNCHRVIKLSSVLQSLAPEKEVVCNVHSDFVREGKRGSYAVTTFTTDTSTKPPCSVYFIVKILWAKGLDRLNYLEHFYRKITGYYFEIDVYGDGSEMPEILRAYHGRNSGWKPRAVAKFIQCLYAFSETAIIEEE